MLAAGIKTPEPLEELEIHLRQLREDLAQHNKLGLEELETSGSAGKKTGEVGLLNERSNMSDLEKSITDWRKQMLAAGIKTPVPLEELEIHLREEIEQQMKSGLSGQDAFNSAVQKIGEAGLLKTEFKKAGGFLDWLGENKSARTNRILGALWLAYCSLGFFSMSASLLARQYGPDFNLDGGFIIVGLVIAYIYLCGIIGSILLFRGIIRDRPIIRMIALLGLVWCIASTHFRTFSIPVGIFALFNLVSIWLLRPPQKPKLTTR